MDPDKRVPLGDGEVSTLEFDSALALAAEI
jgi:hypothetical protein